MKPALGITGLLAAALVLATSSEARAAGGLPNGFGEKGELIVSADRLVPLFTYTYGSRTDTNPGNDELTSSRSGAGLSLLWGRDFNAVEDLTVPINVHMIPRVAFDVAVIPHLTVGAGIAFGFGLGGTRKQEVLVNNVKTTQESDAPTATAIGIAPRVGYVLGLTDMFAFWPRAGIGFYSVSLHSEDNENGAVVPVKDSDTLLSLDLDPQFALVPFEHFFITAGPLVNIPITGTRSHQVTRGATTNTQDIDVSLFTIGLTAGLGGWFNVF
jgi:hypothetical protein